MWQLLELLGIPFLRIGISFGFSFVVSLLEYLRQDCILAQILKLQHPVTFTSVSCLVTIATLIFAPVCIFLSFSSLFSY